MPSAVAVPRATPETDPSQDFVRAMPGPVLLFAPDLSLAYASAPAALLKDAIACDGEAATAIRQAAAEAQATRAAAQGRVELTHEEARRVFDLTAVPVASGRVVVLARDVSFETNMRAALIESRQRYKDLVDIASDFAWETGPDGRFAFVSGGGAMGYAAEALVGSRPADLLVDPEAAAGTLPFAATNVVTESEIWLRDAAGARRPASWPRRRPCTMPAAPGAAPAASAAT